MKAVVDNKIPFIRGQIEPLIDDVVYLPGSNISPADVRDADILIVRTRTRCDANLLKQSRVRLVLTATIGYDHLDTLFLQTAHIQWANCPGCNATSVRQYIHSALLVCAMRHVGLSDADASQPILLADAFAQFRALHPTVAVIGVGHVGSAVAALLQHLGFHVLACDPPRGLPVTLSEVAAQADIITFHPNLTFPTPLGASPDTSVRYPSYRLADQSFFRQLRRHPLILNTSRGEVIDEDALLEALEDGQISGAIIDTWTHEPHINTSLMQRTLLSTPHIAGYSADGKATATRMTLQNLCRFIHRPFNLTIEPPALPPHYSYGNIPSGPLHLYDPRVDSNRLRANPELFEQLRGNYPLRREQ